MIKFISCFWNAECYLEKCIETLRSQKDPDFEVYLIDDVSTDNGSNVAKQLISGDPRFRLTINSEKKFKLRNLDELISSFDGEDIVIELDGDDCLFGPEVVSNIRRVYFDMGTWLTNGSFVYSDGQAGFSSKCNPETVREEAFTFSHLRTWKSFLWQAIPKDHLLDDEGCYFKAAPDVAYSLALLELAGNAHYRFIPEIQYIYNAASPYNEHKNGSATGGGIQEQMRSAESIRKKSKLNRLI